MRFVLFVQFSTSNFLYLGTTNASDVAGCGVSSSFPCATLEYVIKVVAQNETTVLIEEGIYYNQPTCVISSPLSLTIQGQGLIPFLLTTGTLNLNNVHVQAMSHLQDLSDQWSFFLE